MLVSRIVTMVTKLLHEFNQNTNINMHDNIQRTEIILNHPIQLLLVEEERTVFIYKMNLIQFYYYFSYTISCGPGITFRQR